MYKILVVGKDGRTDCTLETLSKSGHSKELFTISEFKNPGFSHKSEVIIGNTSDSEFVKKCAKEIKPDFVIIGPEEPLAAGVVDILIKDLGIPCVGPTQLLAQLESSKSFTRELVSKYNIPGNPEYRIFRSLDGLELYLQKLGEFVVKPDGLTSGKGVKVSGEHLQSIKEAVNYSQSILESGHKSIVIEEKLKGEEFSFQSFCDGQHVVDTAAVQDHKRAFEGDNGPNTGGMGSYSCENYSLPFISDNYLKEASKINLAVANAIRNELGSEFKGILYGGFIITKDGLKLLEYNARFGDPEVMNVLPILDADFIDVCMAIINGNLNNISIKFKKKATVCKYLVPAGYPTNPVTGIRINLDCIPEPSDNLKIYYAAVNEVPNGVELTGSRAIALVGIGNNLVEAEKIAENAAKQIESSLSQDGSSPLFHRKDIGTLRLIQNRIEHINQILNRKQLAA